MSITDDSTGLDLAYTEHPVVAFTAGTLSNIAAMVGEVESKLKRGTLSASTSPKLADVQRWLVRAKEELMQVKSFSFARRYAYATVTAGSYRLALPPDYNGGHVRVKDQTNDRTLKIVPAHLYDLKFPNPDAESTAKPVIACIKNMELWLAPPASACTIELDYDRSAADNTPTDFSFLPEVERFRCSDYAIAEAAESLEDWEKANWYRRKWQVGLQTSRKADARRKWKNMGFRAISVFEEAATRVYQG